MASKINWSIWAIGFGFGLAETWHFGWNWAPHSDAEMICDGIALLIISIALVRK